MCNLKTFKKHIDKHLKSDIIMLVREIDKQANLQILRNT